MTLDPFRTTVNFNDYSKEYADQIDERIENDSWRSNRWQPYYVTNTVERVLKRLPEGSEQRRKALSSVRNNVQTEIAEETGTELSNVAEQCHQNLFEGYEEPQNEMSHAKQENKWVPNFEAVIRKIDREWYREHHLI